jgi:DNA replication protein DnaC
LQDELLVRQQRQIDRRVKAADFRELKPLDDFDFAFNPSIKRAQVFDLATCRFIRETKDVLLVGPPGTGKSFLAQAIGYQAIKQGLIVWYRSISGTDRRLVGGAGLPAGRTARRAGSQPE